MHMRPRRVTAAILLGAATATIVVGWAGSANGRAAWSPGSALPGLGPGRVWSVATSPKTAGLVLAGTDDGVFVSVNSGATWTASTLKAGRVWTVGFDSRDPTRLFAGTDGKGVYLSTDGGATWTDVSAGLQNLTVRTLAFGLDGIAAGTNRGVALSPDGTAWHDGGLDQYSISALAVAANTPSLVLVASSDRGNLSNGYLFRFGTSGAAWQTLQSGLPSSAVATAVAAAVWPGLEWLTRGKPTVLGFCSGAVAGLVVITPASGFVTPGSAVIIGLLAGIVPFLACTKLKAFFKYDDALDTFGVHGVGGTLGALCTGFFASPEANPNLNTNLAGIVGKSLWVEQLKAMGLTLVLSVGATAVIAFALKAALGLRPSIESEEQGLDDADHGEAGYHPDEGGGHGEALSEPALSAAAGLVTPAL